MLIPLILLIFIIGQWNAAFGVIYLFVLILGLIFTNLGNDKKPGELSAYSMFNPGNISLPGQSNILSQMGLEGPQIKEEKRKVDKNQYIRNLLSRK